MVLVKGLEPHGFPPDFESGASAIPPHQHDGDYYNASRGKLQVLFFQQALEHGDVAFGRAVKLVEFDMLVDGMGQVFK